MIARLLLMTTTGEIYTLLNINTTNINQIIHIVMHASVRTDSNRARQLYKNISMLFLFPVKDGKLSTRVNAQLFLSCYG